MAPASFLEIVTLSAPPSNTVSPKTAETGWEERRGLPKSSATPSPDSLANSVTQDLRHE